MEPHVEEEVRTGEEEGHHEVDNLEGQEAVGGMVREEDMAQEEEVCGDLPRRAGIPTDVVDGLQTARQWVVVLRLQDTTTITSITKDHHLANNHHMVEVRHLGQCHKCQLAKLSRWITAWARLLTTMG
jgi:hypothetical protein